MPDSEVEPTPYESTDRTTYRRPWHPTFHDLRSPGKRGLCTRRRGREPTPGEVVDPGPPAEPTAGAYPFEPSNYYAR